MSSPLSSSLLITPDLRRQLQQRYEEAERQAAGATPDFGRIHQLLAECVRADPANQLYLDALLANLRRWRPKRSWWAAWLRRWPWASAAAESGADRLPGTPYSVPSTQYRELQAAPARLLSQPDDPGLFRQLAAAAGDSDFGEVELRYWRSALAIDPAHVESRRGLALALTRQGHFQQAAAAWQDLAGHAPTQAEAQAALTDLEPQTEQRFDEQERELAEAQAAGGSPLKILAERENLQLARAEHRLQAARRRAASDPHPRAQLLVQRLAAESGRLEIEILHLRCERLPGDWQVRLELARRLKQAGNFSGAVQRLEETARIHPGEAAVLTELGECWQHLRQFAKALEHYRQAIAASSGDAATLALYRAGVLAGAMGQTSEARQFFARLVAIDPAFKDARERLDKLEGS